MVITKINSIWSTKVRIADGNGYDPWRRYNKNDFHTQIRFDKVHNVRLESQ